MREAIVHQWTHLSERRAENDEIGVPDGGQQIRGGIIHRARFFAVLHTGGTANVTGNPAMRDETAAFDRKTQRTAEQPDTDDGDFVPTHGVSFVFQVAGFKLQVGSENLQIRLAKLNVLTGALS